MQLSQTHACVRSRRDEEPESALSRTTHLGIVAHADDLEIGTIHGILECYGRSDRAFCGVVVTDGAGSARSGAYADCTDEELRRLRRSEQDQAAELGEYSAWVQLDHPSSAVKDGAQRKVVDDLVALAEAARAEVVYTHSPCDRHDTHVAVLLRTIAALRELPIEKRPRQVIGCEVWGDLDWLPDEHRVVMDVSAHVSLQADLLAVFRSQVAGGKRYDLGALGRRRAHATFSSSHEVDRSEGLVYGVDLTSLVTDPQADVLQQVSDWTAAFTSALRARIERLR